MYVITYDVYEYNEVDTDLNQNIKSGWLSVEQSVIYFNSLTLYNRFYLFFFS